jgi:hypothetical protein
MAATDDIYTEPANVDVNTLANLGPLTPMAGIFTGSRGVDIFPNAKGTETAAFIDRIELQPIDPQTSGPQLLYGLRYHQRVVKPGEIATYHDQIGYWLWEPATETVMQTVAIPRGQVVLAAGRATADAKSFELVAKRGTEVWGICSNPFIDEAFRTVEYRIRITAHDDGTWSYDEDTVLMIRGRSEPFHHRDRSTLTRVTAPTPNPLAQAKK